MLQRNALSHVSQSYRQVTVSPVLFLNLSTQQQSRNSGLIAISCCVSFRRRALRGVTTVTTGISSLLFIIFSKHLFFQNLDNNIVFRILTVYHTQVTSNLFLRHCKQALSKTEEEINYLGKLSSSRCDNIRVCTYISVLVILNDPVFRFSFEA
jgi:hypothetical protein